MLVLIHLIIYEAITHIQTLDPFDGRHMEWALSSVDQDVAPPFANGSSAEGSECNIASDSQYRNRLPSIHDPPESSKEKAAPQDIAEDSDGTSTSTQKSIEELLAMVSSRIQELRKNNVQPNSHSPPQSGQYFAQPHSHPIPVSGMAQSTLTPEYRMPWIFATNVHHHLHYHYNAPNISPPPIINKNIVKINNKNTSKGSDSSESGDDQGGQ